VLAAHRGLSLVLAQPKTGRTHQLRVHFAHMGYPILGDEIYGTPSAIIARHGLHALSLSLPLPFAVCRSPVSHEASANGLNTTDREGYLHTWAPLPEDMKIITDEYFPSLIPDAPNYDTLRLLGFET